MGQILLFFRQVSAYFLLKSSIWKKVIKTFPVKATLLETSAGSPGKENTSNYSAIHFYRKRLILAYLLGVTPNDENNTFKGLGAWISFYKITLIAEVRVIF